MDDFIAFGKKKNQNSGANQKNNKIFKNMPKGKKKGKKDEFESDEEKQEKKV